jgi:hypothetical protein
LPKLTLPADLRRYSDGLPSIAVSAHNYRELVVELQQRFPNMPVAAIGKCALAIDGIIIHSPLLETFGSDSELVLVPRISGG